MKLDVSKMNLTERDIEDWLYENPNQIMTTWGVIEKWIGRQYQLPSGIADLVGIIEGGIVAVVEVKNVPINKAALTQVCRYAADIQEILNWKPDYPNEAMRGLNHVEKMVVGPSIDDQTFMEAEALDVDIHEFAPRLEIDLDRIAWTDETRQSYYARCRELAHQPEWDGFGKHIDILQKEYEEAIHDSSLDKDLESSILESHICRGEIDEKPA